MVLTNEIKESAMTVTGGTKRERQLVEDAMIFAVNYLMPRKKKLWVDVELTNLEGDVVGFHDCEDKYQHTIEVQKGQTDEELLTTIFHEMVHVRQSERGYLKDKGLVKVWKGQEYVHIYSCEEDYKQLPWEAEAYQLQEEMLEQYTKVQ